MFLFSKRPNPRDRQVKEVLNIPGAVLKDANTIEIPHRHPSFRAFGFDTLHFVVRLPATFPERPPTIHVVDGDSFRHPLIDPAGFVQHRELQTWGRGSELAVVIASIKKAFEQAPPQRAHVYPTTFADQEALPHEPTGDEIVVQSFPQATVRRRLGEPVGCVFMGTTLKSVNPATPAASSGLEKYIGCSLTHINNIPVSCFDEIVRILRSVGDVVFTFDPATAKGVEPSSAPQRPPPPPPAPLINTEVPPVPTDYPELDMMGLEKLEVLDSLPDTELTQQLQYSGALQSVVQEDEAVVQSLHAKLEKVCAEGSILEHERTSKKISRDAQLREVERLKQRTDAVNQLISPDAVVKKMAATIQRLEESSDGMWKDLMTGAMDVRTFLERYREERKRYHLKKLTVEAFTAEATALAT